MPIYEYECCRCGHRFELMQKFDDPPRKRCPECRGKVERLISAPAIRFKGSGWYVTDYAGKGKPPEGTGDEAAKPESSRDGETAAAADTGGKPPSGDAGASGKADKESKDRTSRKRSRD